jgi:hypothetical protein
MPPLFIGRKDTGSVCPGEDLYLRSTADEAIQVHSRVAIDPALETQKEIAEIETM